LVTHGPPYGILDKTDGGKHGGSEFLLKEVLRIKPKLHLFGHIHEGRGQYKK
jgi:Icc-related predicted phosphoesterase